MSSTTPLWGGFLIFYLTMITSETPYKLAEIIRDTWPGLYKNEKASYDDQKTLNHERILDSQRTKNREDNSTLW
jgi:hypothetical protein